MADASAGQNFGDAQRVLMAREAVESVIVGSPVLRPDAQRLRDALRFVSVYSPHAPSAAPACGPRLPVLLPRIELPDCVLPESDNSILVDAASRRDVLTHEESQHYAVYHHTTGMCEWAPEARMQLQSRSLPPKPLFPSVDCWVALTDEQRASVRQHYAAAIRLADERHEFALAHTPVQKPAAAAHNAASTPMQHSVEDSVDAAAAPLGTPQQQRKKRGSRSTSKRSSTKKTAAAAAPASAAAPRRRLEGALDESSRPAARAPGSAAPAAAAAAATEQDEQPAYENDEDLQEPILSAAPVVSDSQALTVTDMDVEESPPTGAAEANASEEEKQAPPHSQVGAQQAQQSEQPDTPQPPVPFFSAEQEQLDGVSTRHAVPPDAASVTLQRVLSGTLALLPLSAPQYQRRYPGMLCGYAGDSAVVRTHSPRPYVLMHALDRDAHVSGSSTLDADLQGEFTALVPYWSFHLDAAPPVEPDCLQTTCVGQAVLLADCRRIDDEATAAQPLPQLLLAERREPRNETGPSSATPLTESSRHRMTAVERYHAQHPWMGEKDWQARVCALHHAAVTLLRVDDESSVPGADRNWPSGVLRMVQEGQGQGGLPIRGHTMVLLQLQAKEGGAACGGGPAGHVEPLLLASDVFRRCAGVSHPLFTGRPAAWIPFLPHRAERRFATLYYDGLINIQLDSVRWARPPAVALHISEPFSPRATRAVIRAGSVVKFRVERSSATGRPWRGESMATEASAAAALGDEPAQEWWGLVLLTYVDVSKRITGQWLEECRRRFPEQTQLLTRFCALFPGTPVCMCAVQRLDGMDPHREGFYPAVSVWDVLEVQDGPRGAVPAGKRKSSSSSGAHELLWSEDAEGARKLPHLVDKPKSKPAHKKKAQAGGVRVEQVTLPRTRCHKLLEHEYSDAHSKFRAWFSSQMQETRTAPTDDPPSLHSFYHDIVRDAAQGISAEQMECLMAVRRLINVPQPQPQPSEDCKEGPDPEAEQRAAAEHEEASASTTTPAAATSRPQRTTRTQPAAPSGGAAAAAPAAAVPLVARWEVKDALSALFSQLSNVDEDLSLAPFASFVTRNMTEKALQTLCSSGKYKKRRQDQQDALKYLAQHERDSLEVLHTSAAKHVELLGEDITARLPTRELEEVCGKLAALQTAGDKAPARWYDTHGVRPQSGAGSRVQRLNIQQQQQQQPLPQQHLQPSLLNGGLFSLPQSSYGAMLPVPPAAAAWQQQLDAQQKFHEQREREHNERFAKLEKELEQHRLQAAAAVPAAARAPASGAPSTSPRPTAAQGRAPTNSAGSNNRKHPRDSSSSATSDPPASSRSREERARQREQGRAGAQLLQLQQGRRSGGQLSKRIQDSNRRVQQAVTRTEEEDDDDANAMDDESDDEAQAAAAAAAAAATAGRPAKKARRTPASRSRAASASAAQPSPPAAAAEPPLTASTIKQIMSEQLATSLARLEANGLEREAKLGVRVTDVEQQVGRAFDNFGLVQVAVDRQEQVNSCNERRFHKVEDEINNHKNAYLALMECLGSSGIEQLKYLTPRRHDPYKYLTGAASSNGAPVPAFTLRSSGDDMSTQMAAAGQMQQQRQQQLTTRTQFWFPTKREQQAP